MPLSPGTRVGSYEITAAIGAGGMGEVYRARDSRLKREVAIKVLPAGVASDPERLARLQREAEVLASLNHPNIAHVYGVEDRALVMELVEGDDLAQQIARGPIPVNEALPIARQIAEALEAAHAAGVVHRDLKPANVKVRPDGTVKVLDFGLAKALEGPNASGGSGQDAVLNSPTITAPAMTAAGIILGTAAYMSPEQARAKPVDKRADIWAFGCVLYEMVAGRAAFAADTITDTLAALVSRDPDWSALPPVTPPALHRLLRRCLEKDVRRRLRDIGDAYADLDEAALVPVVQQAAARARGGSRMLAGAALGIAATLVVGLLVLNRSRAADAAPEYARIVRLTSGPDREVAPAVSPDGKWVAYISDAGGRPDIWVKFLAGGEAANLTATANLDISSGTGIGGLEISPDGTRMAFQARPRGTTRAFSTWEIPAPLPGAARQLLEENLLGMRWSPDGRQITFVGAGAASGDALHVADETGSNRRLLIEAQNGMHIHWPHWSTDGHIYFIRTFTTFANLDASDIYRIKASGDAAMEPVVATARRALFPLVLPDAGGLIYSANPNTAELRLWWRSVDGRVNRQLTNGVGEYAEPRASADGRTVVSTVYDLRQSLTRVSATGASVATTTPVTDGFQGDLDPTVSPGGDRLAFSSSRDGNRHIWTSRLDGSDPRPLTFGNAQDDRPAYAPDGGQLAFVSDRDGARAIWVVAAEGGPARKVLDVVPTGGLTWSRDGRHIVYAAGEGAGTRMWSVPVSGGTPRPIDTPAFAAEPSWCPTRDVIAYLSVRRESGVAISKVAFVDPSGNALPELPDVPAGNGFTNGMLAWSRDGRRLAVVRQQSNSASEIWIVDPSAPAPYTKLLEFPPGPRVRGLTWTDNDAALIVGLHDWSSDIVLMDQRR